MWMFGREGVVRWFGVPITMAVFCLGFSDIVSVSWGLLGEGDACLSLGSGGMGYGGRLHMPA